MKVLSLFLAGLLLVFSGVAQAENPSQGPRPEDRAGVPHPEVVQPAPRPVANPAPAPQASKIAAPLPSPQPEKSEVLRPAPAGAKAPAPRR